MPIARGSMRRFILPVLLLCALLLASGAIARGPWDAAEPDPPPADSAPGAAGATDASAQAEPSAGAPQPLARQVTLTAVGALNPDSIGFHGDIWSHKGVAYLGTWGTTGICPASGVKVIDVQDPTRPRTLTTLAAWPGTSQEDIVVRAIATAAFHGDLLAAGIQSCDGSSPGGLALFDVSDPAQPVELAFLPSGGRGVHELDLIQQGSRALALLAVPDSELRSGRGGDFRIVDVSDPRRPVQIADWGLRAGLGLDPSRGIGCVERTYGHSARASADGRHAYLSYWDAGVVILDISDPAAPRFLGRAAYADTAAGTTHSVAEAAGGRVLLSADEETVFEAPPGVFLEVSGAAGTVSVSGCVARISPSLDAAGRIEAELVDVSAACGLNLPPVRERVVLLEGSGRCPVAQSLDRLAADGARAVLVTQPGRATSGSGGARAPLPTVIIAESDAPGLRELARGGARVTLPAQRPWGGLRIWDIADPTRPRQVATFQTENSLRFPAPDGGYYTIHNPEVTGDLAVLSWWSDGVRVVDLSDPANPREVASYLPPPAPNPQRAVFPSGTMVWGVHIDGDLVFVSDVNSGLHILRLER